MRLGGDIVVFFRGRNLEVADEESCDHCKLTAIFERAYIGDSHDVNHAGLLQHVYRHVTRFVRKIILTFKYHPII